jgi:glycosyltransferase involved in cell wall biosynthesis
MLITVVTPTLNAREYLRECIESVKINNTDDIRVEHVIVDGGSVDGTVELAESYGLRVLKGKDQGIFDAINKGSFNSSGELIGFLGADDVILKGALENLVKAYGKSNRRWIVGGIRWIDEHGRSLGDLAAPPRWMTARMHACLHWNPIMHMATYFSRDFFTALGGYNINYKDAGDFEMFARALRQEPYERISTTVACFRRTGMNNSVVNAERANREMQSVADQFGPRSSWERVCWRYLLKIWFNFRNPEWLAKKLAERISVVFGLQESVHF